MACIWIWRFIHGTSAVCVDCDGSDTGYENNFRNFTWAMNFGFDMNKCLAGQCIRILMSGFCTFSKYRTFRLTNSIGFTPNFSDFMGAGSCSGAINLALLGGMIIFDFRINVKQVSQLPFECHRNPQNKKSRSSIRRSKWVKLHKFLTLGPETISQWLYYSVANRFPIDLNRKTIDLSSMSITVFQLRSVDSM